MLGVRVDRKRKQSAIVFLMAIGMTKPEIREAFKGYPLVLDALDKETIETQDEALTDLYRKIRPADTATPEAGKNLLESFYFNTKPVRSGGAWAATRSTASSAWRRTTTTAA